MTQSANPLTASERILVFGATGAQGLPVASRLLDAGYQVRAVARHPDRAGALISRGAEAMSVDLADPGSVRAVSAGIDRVFLHLPMLWGGPGAVLEAREALDAMVAEGVRQIVFSTSQPVPDQPVGVPGLDEKAAVVQHVLATGVGTVLKPTAYMENLSSPWSAPRVARGELAYPLPATTRVAWITNDDVAAFAVAAFREPGAIGASHAIAGPEALGGDQVADQLSRALARPVVYRKVSGQEYAAMLEPHLGPQTARMIGGFYASMPPGEMPAMTPDVGPALAALPVQLTSVEEWARSRSW